jgi:hypothetical protein
MRNQKRREIYGLEPYWYLRFLFEKPPFAQTLEDKEALLPQNMSPDPIPSVTAVV